MKAKKILYITQEITPFDPETEMSLLGRYLPQAIQESGHEIRMFTPKWGVINERRNQLHEVIRLSGMNIIIDGTDHPLIIKVASLAAARMQIYFIDNDDYFQKRGMLVDNDGKEYNDNGERAIFYARGVLETVKKLRWIPDVIHCQGWITALAPLYIKKAYKDEPSFSECKVVFSASQPQFQQPLESTFSEFLNFRNANSSDFADIIPATGVTHDDLCKIAIKYSDGFAMNDANVSPELVEYAKSLGIPVLEAQTKETYAQAYGDFYENVIG